MSVIKSFYVDRGKEIRGDMFYIKHNTSCFTMIDCCLKADDDRRCEIVMEIKRESKGRVCRFISTHPHDDHIHGIEFLNKFWPIKNFYAVENSRECDDESFQAYSNLKNLYNFPLKKGIKRKWLNTESDERGGSGIEILWPNVDNDEFKKALDRCQDDPNAISAVIKYNSSRFSVVWMGDLETSMQETFFESEKKNLGEIDVLFLPHHGRSSANVPEDLLKKWNPKLIIIGAAPCDQIDYNHYDSDKTLTQNTALDFILEITDNGIDVYTEGNPDNMPKCLKKYRKLAKFGMNYQGSLMKKG